MQCNRAKQIVVSLTLGFFILVQSIGLASAGAAPARQGPPNPFFAMDTGTKDAKHQTPEAQAALVKELGYDGIGCDINQMPGMLKAVDGAGLKLFAVYVGASVDPAKPKYDKRLPGAIKALKGRETFVWLFVTNGSPSSSGAEERAVATVCEVADLAAESGLRVALYPHTGFYISRIEDAVRVAKKTGRKNVGVTFNLCHWLRVEGSGDWKKTLEEAKPHLYVVTINGADKDGKDWNTLIQTLDRGTFDNLSLLRELKRLGFKGPIGLQHYGIKGDARENLMHSMNAWRDLTARLKAESESPK